MSEIRDFSPDQTKEAQDWYQENFPVLNYVHFSDEVKNALYGAYFSLKTISMELRPNQFIVGVDYKKQEDVLSGKELISLSFWNPHPKGMADKFAKDFLIAKLSTL